MGNPLKYIDLFIKPVKMDGILVGVYPIYVLRSGAFLAGALFFLKRMRIDAKS